MEILGLDEYTTLNESKVISEDEIRDALEKYFVAFVYYKKEGERRLAYGTLRPDFLEKHAQYKRKTKRKNAANGVKSAEKKHGYIVYFDLERGEYRMFRLAGGVHIHGKSKSYKDFYKKYSKESEIEKY